MSPFWSKSKDEPNEEHDEDQAETGEQDIVSESEPGAVSAAAFEEADEESTPEPATAAAQSGETGVGHGDDAPAFDATPPADDMPSDEYAAAEPDPSNTAEVPAVEQPPESSQRELDPVAEGEAVELTPVTSEPLTGPDDDGPAFGPTAGAQDPFSSTSSAAAFPPGPASFDAGAAGEVDQPDRPEVYAGAAFAGGLALAFLFKRLGS